MKKPGLAALTACALMVAGHTQAGVNLVANGDFDADSPTPETAPLDWTLTTAALGSNFDVGDEIGFVSGPNAANFGAVGIGHEGDTLSQTIPTVVGQEYIVSFDLATTGGGNFQAIVDSSKLTFYLIDPPSSSFKDYTFTFTATNSSTDLTFRGFNPLGWFALDNVSMVAAPEPATWALMLAGLAGLGAALRSRRSSLPSSAGA